jgi:hypothetical protein
MRGDGQNQLKISAPHPMTETYRFISLLAALIALDSPFKLSLSSCSGLHFIICTMHILLLHPELFYTHNMYISPRGLIYIYVFLFLSLPTEYRQ